jgi:hypothetical protein
MICRLVWSRLMPGPKVSRADDGYRQMTDCIELNTANYHVLAKQHLANSPTNVAITSVVRDVAGLHAGDVKTPYLSLVARLPGFEKEQLQEALYAEHSLAKVRSVRRELYVHCVENLPRIFAATGAAAAKASENYMVYRGVSMAEYELLSERVLNTLSDNELTAAQIKQDLSTNKDISAVLEYMSDKGLLLRVASSDDWLEEQPRYSLLSEVHPKAVSGELNEKDEMAALVRDYISAFGPVSSADIVWWTGLGKIRVRSALRTLRGQLVDVRICGSPDVYHMLQDDLRALSDLQSIVKPNVNLLPADDGFLLGYADQSRFIDPKYRDRVVDSSGNITNVVLVDGQILGVWDFEEANVPTVKVHMFDFVQHLAGEKVFAQAKRLGEFMSGKDVRFRQCDKMEPLNKRPPGSYLSPLAGC